jgi:membrane protein insertase Oxa1/YidC/SpoIIIJ
MPNTTAFPLLMAILNVEQARLSNVKRDQPNPKFASNWHLTEFFRIFLLIFLSNFLFLVTELAMFDGSSNH